MKKIDKKVGKNTQSDVWKKWFDVDENQHKVINKLLEDDDDDDVNPPADPGVNPR